MVVIFNDDVLEELARIDNNITISSYSLVSIVGDLYTPSVLVGLSDTNIKVEALVKKDNLLGAWDKSSCSFNTCLNLIAEDFSKFNETGNPINIIKFYTKNDEGADITAFILVNPADPEQNNQGSSIYPTKLDLTIGKNLIKIVFPSSTLATVVSANEDKIERFLSSPSPDTGTNMFNLSAGGEVTITNDSFYKFFGNSITKQDIEALPLVVNDTAYLDRLGRKVTEDYTYRIYKSIEFFAAGLDYVCWVPTVFGLYVNYDLYNGGRIKLLGLADFDEYHVLDGETCLIGTGKEAIESIPGVEFEEVDNNGLIYTIDYNNQVLDYTKPSGDPNYNDSATLRAVIRNTDGSIVTSEKVRFYLGTKDKEWEVKDKTTNYFEPVKEGDYVENIPVYLFNYIKSVKEKDKLSKKWVKTNVHSFSIVTSLYIKDASDIKLTLENEKLSSYFDVVWKVSRYLDGFGKFKNSVIEVDLLAKQENKDNFNWYPLNDKKESELMLATLSYEYYNTKFYLVQSPKVDGLNLYEFNSVGANFSKVSSIEFGSAETERIYWMMTESKTAPSVMPFWKTVLTEGNQEANISVTGVEYKKKTSYTRKQKYDAHDYSYSDYDPGSGEVVETDNYGKFTITEKRSFRPDVEVIGCATGFYDVTDVEMLPGPKYVTVLDQLAIDKNGYVIIGTSMVVSEEGDTQYNSSLRDDSDLRIVLTKGDKLSHPFTKVMSTYMINNDRLKELSDNLNKTALTDSNTSLASTNSTVSFVSSNKKSNSTTNLAQNSNYAQIVSEQGTIPDLLQTNVLTDGRLSSAGYGKDKFSEYYITNAAVIGNYIGNVEDTKVTGLTGSVNSSSTSDEGNLIEEQQEDSVLAFVREDGSIGYTSKADGIAVKLVVDTEGKMVTDPRKIWDNKVLRPVIVKIPKKPVDVNELVFDPITFYRVTSDELNDPEFDYSTETWRNMVRRAQITVDVRKEGQEPFIQIIGKIRNSDKKVKKFKNNRFIPTIVRASSSDIETSAIGRGQFIVRSNCPFTLNFKYRDGFEKSLAFDNVPKIMKSYTLANDLQTLYSNVFDVHYGKGIFFDVVEADETGVICDLIATYKELEVSTTITANEFSGYNNVSLVDKDGVISSSAVDRLVIINKGISKSIYVNSRRTAYNIYRSYIDFRDITREDGKTDKEPIVVYNPNNARKATKVGNLRISGASPRFNENGYVNHALTLDLEGTTNANYYPLSPIGRLSTLPYNGSDYYKFGSSRGTDVYLYEQGLNPDIKVTSYPGALGAYNVSDQTRPTLEYVSGTSRGNVYNLKKYNNSDFRLGKKNIITVDRYRLESGDKSYAIPKEGYYAPICWTSSQGASSNSDLYMLPGVLLSEVRDDTIGSLSDPVDVSNVGIDYEDNNQNNLYRSIGLTSDDLYTKFDNLAIWSELKPEMIEGGEVVITNATYLIGGTPLRAPRVGGTSAGSSIVNFGGNVGEQIYSMLKNYSCTYIADNAEDCPLPIYNILQDTGVHYCYSNDKDSIGSSSSLNCVQVASLSTVYMVGEDRYGGDYTVARTLNSIVEVEFVDSLKITYPGIGERIVPFFKEKDNEDQPGRYFILSDENFGPIYKKVSDSGFGNSIKYKMSNNDANYQDPTTKFTIQTRYPLQYVSVGSGIVNDSPTKYYTIGTQLGGQQVGDALAPDYVSSGSLSPGEKYSLLYDIDVHKQQASAGVGIEVLSISGREIQTTGDGFRYEYTFNIGPTNPMGNNEDEDRRFAGQIIIDSRVRSIYASNTAVPEDLIKSFPTILPLYSSNKVPILGKTRPLLGVEWGSEIPGTFDYAYESTILPVVRDEIDRIVPSRTLRLDIYQQKNNILSLVGNRLKETFYNEKRIFYIRPNLDQDSTLSEKNLYLRCSDSESADDNNITIVVDNYSPNTVPTTNLVKPNATLTFNSPLRYYYPAFPDIALGEVLSKYKNNGAKEKEVTFTVDKGSWVQKTGQYSIDTTEYLKRTDNYTFNGISYLRWEFKSNNEITYQSKFDILIDPSKLPDDDEHYSEISDINYLVPDFTITTDDDVIGNYFVDICGKVIVKAEKRANEWVLFKSNSGTGKGYIWNTDTEHPVHFKETLTFEERGIDFGLMCASTSNKPKLYLGDYIKNTIKETISGKSNYLDLFAGVFSLSTDEHIDELSKDLCVYAGTMEHTDFTKVDDSYYYVSKRLFGQSFSIEDPKAEAENAYELVKYSTSTNKRFSSWIGLIFNKTANDLSNITSDKVVPINYVISKSEDEYDQDKRLVYKGVERLGDIEYDSWYIYNAMDCDHSNYFYNTGNKVYTSLSEYEDIQNYAELNNPDKYIEPAYYVTPDDDNYIPTEVHIIVKYSNSEESYWFDEITTDWRIYGEPSNYTHSNKRCLFVERPGPGNYTIADCSPVVKSNESGTKLWGALGASTYSKWIRITPTDDPSVYQPVDDYVYLMDNSDEFFRSLGDSNLPYPTINNPLVPLHLVVGGEFDYYSDRCQYFIESQKTLEQPYGFGQLKELDGSSKYYWLRLYESDRSTEDLFKNNIAKGSNEFSVVRTDDVTNTWNYELISEDVSMSADKSYTNNLRIHFPENRTENDIERTFTIVSKADVGDVYHAVNLVINQSSYLGTIWCDDPVRFRSDGSYFSEDDDVFIYFDTDVPSSELEYVIVGDSDAPTPIFSVGETTDSVYGLDYNRYRLFVKLSRNTLRSKVTKILRFIRNYSVYNTDTGKLTYKQKVLKEVQLVQGYRSMFITNPAYQQEELSNTLDIINPIPKILTSGGVVGSFADPLLVPCDKSTYSDPSPSTQVYLMSMKFEKCEPSYLGDFEDPVLVEGADLLDMLDVDPGSAVISDIYYNWKILDNDTVNINDVFPSVGTEKGYESIIVMSGEPLVKASDYPCLYNRYVTSENWKGLEVTLLVTIKVRLNSAHGGDEFTYLVYMKKLDS